MSGRTITVRIPCFWLGVNSKCVRSWLLDYCREPTSNLPADPGPGSKRVSLSLPKRAIKMASAVLDESESATLRRIIASRVNALPAAHSSFSLPAVRAQALLSSSVPLARTVVSPRRPVLAPSRYRRGDVGGWIPLRSLERSAVPVSRVGAALSVESAPSESPSLLDVAMWAGIAILVVWVLIRLFQGGPKGAPRFGAL